MFCDMGRQTWYFIARVPMTCPKMAESKFQNSTIGSLPRPV